MGAYGRSGPLPFGPLQGPGRLSGCRGNSQAVGAGFAPGTVLMFALDTNTLICFFKGPGHIEERLLAVPPSGDRDSVDCYL